MKYNYGQLYLLKGAVVTNLFTYIIIAVAC